MLLLRRAAFCLSLLGLCLFLTACPHHIEQMVEKMAPPKGYKPSYTTSTTSLKKLLQQNKPAPEAASSATAQLATSFDPSALAAFPYTEIGKNLPVNLTSATLGGMDSSALAGMDLPKGLAGGQSDMSYVMKGFLGDSALRQTLLSGKMDSALSSFKKFGGESVSGASSDDISASMPEVEKLLQDSSFAKMLGSLPSVLPNDVLKTLPSRMPGSSKDISQIALPTPKKSSKSPKFAKGKSPGALSESPSTQDLPQSMDGITEGMTEKFAQLLPQMQAMKQAYMSAGRVAAERRAQEEYERISLAEEREAERLAKEPAIMPVNVIVRSINDQRYPDEIELNVTVVDTAGRFISGLAPPNFQGAGNYRSYWRALADSCPQMTSTSQTRVRSFDVQEIAEGSLDTHAVAFVLDHSPSMGDTRARRLQEAVARTMGIVKKQDFITAIKFTSKVKIEVPLTNDSNAYREGFLIDGLEGYGGGTAIYDGVLAAIKELQKAPKGASKVVILFTDGDDNSSKSRINAVYKAAKENNVRIYSIAYGMTEETPLQNLAQYTGGMMYRLYSVKEFPLAFADLYKALKNYYRVRYHPPESASLHTVHVRLAVPELATVSTGTAQYDRSVFTPLDTVGSVQLVNIEFETGKSTIRPVSMLLLRDIAQYMKRSKKSMMEVRGHTDNKGGAEFNQKLSEARAEAVVAALLSMGVSREQLRSVGYGETKPLAPNDTEENRRRNRRTEFALVEK